jgi:hypothetical protein
LRSEKGEEYLTRRGVASAGSSRTSACLLPTSVARLFRVGVSFGSGTGVPPVNGVCAFPMGRPLQRSKRTGTLRWHRHSCLCYGGTGTPARATVAQALLPVRSCLIRKCRNSRHGPPARERSRPRWRCHSFRSWICNSVPQTWGSVFPPSPSRKMLTSKNRSLYQPGHIVFLSHLHPIQGFFGV